MGDWERSPRDLTFRSSRPGSVRSVLCRRERHRLLDELGLRDRAGVQRGYGIAIALVVAVGVAMGATRLGRGSLSHVMDILGRAQPGWLLVAVACFSLALLSSAAAWHAGLRACGGSACFTQVSARYAIGSLVNAVTPAHLGGAVRLALLSRTLPGVDRLWRAGGVGASVAGARTLALAVLVVAAASVGSVPVWPAPLLAGAVVAALFVCTRFSARAEGHLASLLQIFRSYARAPRAAANLVAWIGCAFAARVGAATAVGMALHIPQPLWVALVLLASLALAGVFPLTPGNFGTGAGAATLALYGAGVDVASSLALGLAFQALETAAATVLGLGGAAMLAAPGTRARRWSLAAAGAAAVLVAATLGITSVDLV